MREQYIYSKEQMRKLYETAYSAMSEAWGKMPIDKQFEVKDFPEDVLGPEFRNFYAACEKYLEE